MPEQQSLWLCEWCDHAPYHSEKLLARHVASKHSEDGKALFGRDMTYRALVRKATRVAKVVVVVSGATYDDAWKSCYDATIDLLLSGQPVTYRNIRRDAYRMLFNEHETSLDEMRLDGDDGSDDTSDTFATSHAYAMPEAAYMQAETLLEVAIGKFAIESPMFYLGQADESPRLTLLNGYDALLANIEEVVEPLRLQAASEHFRLDETVKRGRPRKETSV